MTELIEQAIARTKALPAKEQDAIAAMILEELEAENRCDQVFASSQNVLAQLTLAAMAEHHAANHRARPRHSVKSRITSQFRKAFAKLPKAA